MKQNQKGFTIFEIILVIVFIALIVGGFFLVSSARHNFSHTVTAPSNNKASKGKIEGSAIAYAGQSECHQDSADSPDTVRNKGTGLYVGVDQTFGTITDSNRNATDSLNTPTNATLKTISNTYPLTFDTTNSYLGANRIALIFDFISTTKDMALSLTKTNATISYTIKSKSYTTPAFAIDDCVVKPLI